jgi:hypothetical protein
MRFPYRTTFTLFVYLGVIICTVFAVTTIGVGIEAILNAY